MRFESVIVQEIDRKNKRNTGQIDNDITADFLFLSAVDDHEDDEHYRNQGDRV